MDAVLEDHMMLSFQTQPTTPPLGDEPAVLVPLSHPKLPDDKLEPMDRQSSDTTQSYSLEHDFTLNNWDPDDTTDYPIFSLAKQLPGVTGEGLIDEMSKPVTSLIQHLNAKGNSLLWELLLDENIVRLPVEFREMSQQLLAELIKQIKSNEVR